MKKLFTCLLAVLGLNTACGKGNFAGMEVTFETKNGEMGRLRWKSGS